MRWLYARRFQAWNRRPRVALVSTPMDEGFVGWGWSRDPGRDDVRHLSRGAIGATLLPIGVVASITCAFVSCVPGPQLGQLLTIFLIIAKAEHLDRAICRRGLFG